MCRLSVDVYLPCPEGLCSHNSDLICTSGEHTHTHTHTHTHSRSRCAHATNHPFKPSFICPSSKSIHSAPHFHFLIYPPLYAAEFLPSLSPCFHSYILLKSNWPHLPPLPPSLPPLPPFLPHSHLPRCRRVQWAFKRQETMPSISGWSCWLLIFCADIQYLSNWPISRQEISVIFKKKIKMCEARQVIG